MITLEDAVARWRRTSFPPGSAHDALNELHANLALYDTWVAESVLPFVNQGVWEPVIPDVLAALDGLSGEVSGLRFTKESDKETAQRYLDYATALRTVYAAFLNAGHH